MKQMLNTIARMLVAAARARAEHVSRTLADASLSRNEVYRANAGGWN